MQDSFTSNSRRRRNKVRQPVIDASALRFRRAREQVPERKRIVLARPGKDHLQCCPALFAGAALKIKFGYGRTQIFRRIFEVGNSRSGLLFCGARGSFLNEGAAVALYALSLADALLDP